MKKKKTDSQLASSSPTVPAPTVFSRSDFERIRDSAPSDAPGGLSLRPRCHDAGLDVTYLDGLMVLTCHACQWPVIRLAVGEWSGPGPKEEVLVRAAADAESRFTGDVPGEIVSPQKLDNAARKNRGRKRA